MINNGLWLYGVFLAAACVIGCSARPALSPAYPSNTKATSQPAAHAAKTIFRGAVTDARTGKPVEGAKVAYIRGSLKKDAAVTDVQGQFELPGLPVTDIVISHERYWSRLIRFEDIGDLRDRATPPGEIRIQVWLEGGPDIIGVVRDADGKPVHGAVVSSREKSATTDAQGRFVVYSPKVWAEGETYLSVSAKGFIPLFIDKLRPGNTPESVVLERPYELVIRAQTPKGEPLRNVSAGVAVPRGGYPAGLEPKTCQAEPGLIRMSFHAAGKRTLWVAARGYSMAEVPVDVVRGMPPLLVKLTEGVTVSGRAEIPGGKFDGGEASLQPQSDLILPGIQVPLKADGSYRFDHSGPGQFDLKVTVPGKTDARAVITVGNANVEVPALAVRGTGTVVGQVFYHGGDNPWPKASGSIWAEDGKQFQFKADKEGRFRVEGVTLGRARVSVGWSTGCLYHSLVADVQVLEGKTQEVMVIHEQTEHPPPATQPVTQPGVSHPATQPQFSLDWK